MKALSQRGAGPTSEDLISATQMPVSGVNHLPIPELHGPLMLGGLGELQENLFLRVSSTSDYQRLAWHRNLVPIEDFDSDTLFVVSVLPFHLIVAQ